MLKLQSPLLIASNHPNSFLDAVILDVLFQQPIWSLARGDVFKKRIFAKILRKLKMLPVYRTREGVENLEHNYTTFSACKEIFKQNGVVLIFSEGLCVNEWHLRPLKKGTARLAISAWQDGIPLKVIPVGMNYSSFHKFGKNVYINFGNTITSENINQSESDGRKHLLFNEQLQAELKQLVFEIAENDIDSQRRKLKSEIPYLKKFVLMLPAIFGYLLNAPYYLLVKSIVVKRVKETGHYDSVLLGVLALTYPLFVLLVSIILFFITGFWQCFLLLLFFPFTAWSYSVIKEKTA